MEDQIDGVSIKAVLKTPIGRNFKIAMGTDEAQIKRANKIYLNESGPGSYEVPSMFA